MELLSTTERIIAGASELFFAHGYSKVTMEEIAESVGITKKTIYNHFPNKLDLLEQVTKTSVQTIMTNLENIVRDSTLDLRERLMKGLEYIFNELSNEKRNLLQDFSKFTPGIVAQLIPQIREKILWIVQQLYDEGVAEGLVKTEVSRDFLPYTYMTLIWGEVVLYRSADLEFNPGELLMHSIKYTLDGVLTDKGSQILLGKGKNNRDG